MLHSADTNIAVIDTQGISAQADDYDEGFIELIVKGVLRDGDSVATLAAARQLSDITQREQLVRVHANKRQHFADGVDQLIWVSAYDVVDDSADNSARLLAHLKANLAAATAVFPRNSPVVYLR